MKTCTAIVIMFGTVAAMIGSAEAANLTYKYERETDRLDLFLEGKIERGDADALKSLLDDKDYNIDMYGTTAVIHLNSSGGNWLEGVALAKLFHDRNIQTYVPDKSSCYSACAIAFLGGGTRHPEGRGLITSRTMTSQSVLAFHAPFFDVNDSSLNYQTMDQAYNAAVDAMRLFLNFIDRTELDIEFVSSLLVSRQNEFKFIETVDDAGRLGVSVVDIDTPKLTEQTITQYCENVFAWSQGDSALQRDDWREHIFTSTEIKTTKYSLGEGRTRWLVPTAYAVEAALFWCVFDTTNDDHFPFDCHGFLHATFAEEAAERAGRDPWDVIVEEDCRYPKSLDTVRSTIGGSESHAFFPPESKLSELSESR